MYYFKYFIALSHWTPEHWLIGSFFLCFMCFFGSGLHAIFFFLLLQSCNIFSQTSYVWFICFCFQHFTGSEYVEKAPLEVCAKLVIESRRERREKERKEKEQKLTDDLAEMKAKREEEAAEKKKVVIVTPEEAKQAGSRKQWWQPSHLIRWDFIQRH